MPSLEPIDPNLLAELIRKPERTFERSLDFQLSLAQYSNTPSEILGILVQKGDWTVAEAAGMHVNLAGELTSDWQKEIDKYLEKAELGQNDRLAVELLKIGSFPPELMSRWIPPDKLIAALKSPDVSKRDRSKLLARLAEKFTVEPRLIAAKSSETPRSVLKKLAEDLDSAVQLAAKDNPNYPPELLKSIDKREQGSRYPNPESDLARDLAMRKEIAQNPLTSTATLDTLSLDLASDVRYLVAGNSSTSMQTLKKLSQDRNEWVKWGILKNPKLNNALLRQLITNSSDTLKIAALCQLQAPIDRVLAEIINRPETLEIILRECFYNNKTVDYLSDNLRSLKAYTFSYNQDYSLFAIAGTLPDSRWICFSPTVPQETGKYPVEGMRCVPISTYEAIDPSYSDVEIQIRQIIEKLSPIQTYGWYLSHYGNIHDYRLIYATGHTLESALENCLMQARLIEVYKFEQFLPRIHGCGYSDRDSRGTKERFERLNCFLKGTFADLRMYRFCFWDWEHLYFLDAQQEDDKAGIIIRSQFICNP